jgi:hypothetical protein
VLQSGVDEEPPATVHVIDVLVDVVTSVAVTV